MTQISSKFSTRLVFVLAALIGLAISPAALAWDLQALVGLGLDFGGDQLVNATYTDGTTSSIEAGRGVLLTAGAVFSPRFEGDHALEIQSTLSFKYATIAAATNQSFSWTRWPLEVIAFYRYVPYRIRLGGGLAYVMGPKISANGTLQNGDVSFNNSLGILFQGDYMFGGNEHFALGARYTVLNLQVSNGIAPAVSANSFGLVLSYLFGGDSPKPAAEVSATAASQDAKTAPKEKDPPGVER